MANLINLFVSHAWRYNTEAIALKTQLTQRGYFPVDFHDIGNHDPVNSINDPYIKSVIRARLDQTHVVLCFNRKYSTSRPWIKFELEEAYKRSIPIIGVNITGVLQHSSLVKRLANVIVNFDIETIVAEIRHYR